MYPRFESARHVVFRDVKRECSPAWMPVINISLSIDHNFGYTPANLAIDRLAATHLMVVAAGNDGFDAKSSTINGFAPPPRFPGVLCVGATDDTSGTQLADYSSRGQTDGHRRPSIVTFGESPLTGAHGTSFAAPRIANLACTCYDAVFQVVAVEFSLRIPEERIGLPLIGWGMVDEFESSTLTLMRERLLAMPFLGVHQMEIADALSTLKRSGADTTFFVRPEGVRQLIQQSAKPMPGYGQHEVGSGFVCESGFLDYLSEQRLGTLVEIFCENIDAAHLPNKVANTKVFDRDELNELSRIGKRSRPIWKYDHKQHIFVVNDGDESSSLAPGGHALEVEYSAKFG